MTVFLDCDRIPGSLFTVNTRYWSKRLPKHVRITGEPQNEPESRLTPITLEQHTVIMDLLGGNLENEDDDALLQLSASVLDAIPGEVKHDLASSARACFGLKVDVEVV